MNGDVSLLLLYDEEKRILLQHREENIKRLPGYWAFFGGRIEKGETPEQALVREVKEELDIELKDYQFFKKYECFEGDALKNIKYVYIGKINKGIDELELQEGQRLKFFKKEEIPQVKFANILKDIVMDYLKSKD